MFPGQGANKPPEGWEYEKVKEPVSENTPKESPPGWEKESEKEAANG